MPKPKTTTRKSAKKAPPRKRGPKPKPKAEKLANKHARDARYRASPKTARQQELLRRRKARHREKITRMGQEVGTIPPVADPARRAAAEGSFRVFCETYFGLIFFLPWSKDLLRVIDKIERVVIDGETFAVAMPRGSGKTRLCQAAALWAILTGKHPFVVVIGAVAGQSVDAIRWFKSALSTNDLLGADFPEACYPIRLLDNEARKCMGQRHGGQRTAITWATDRIVLPTIKGSKASGFCILARSLEGHILGLSLTLPDGRVVRPTLALCDDPQTPESARSQGPAGQTTYRLQVINQSVQALAGPGRPTAILVPCTVIEHGDLADQLLAMPNYRGERTKRVYHWPANKALWEEYRELREQLMRSGESMDEATEFYRLRRATCGRRMDSEPAACGVCARRGECMDCGAQVDWADRLDDPRNLSAVQAAMHGLYKYGVAGFAAEFQNDPLTGAPGLVVLTPDVCASRLNGRPWGEVPLACTELTMGVDVQQSSLWYVVMAWEPNFTGYVVDYGIWPPQNRAIVTAGEVAEGPNSLQAQYTNLGNEGTIQAGLEEFVALSLNRTFPVAGAGSEVRRITRLLVDSGKWTSTIQAVKHSVGGATMLLSKGDGITAGKEPMERRRKKPGEGRHGPGFYEPSTRGTREFRYVMVDTNQWKQNLQDGFLTAPGDPGSLTIFGDKKEQHALFAAHVANSERWALTHGKGRFVHEYTELPSRPDNHWFDAAVLACVAASYQGIKRPGEAESSSHGAKPRVRMSMSAAIAASMERLGQGAPR